MNQNPLHSHSISCCFPRGKERVAVRCSTAAADCKSYSPFTLTGWMLVPSVLRLLHELHNPSMEKRESYFRGQTVRLAQKGKETLHIPCCCVSLGEEKKRRSMQQSLACGCRMSSGIHIIFSVWRADGFPDPLNRALMVE